MKAEKPEVQKGRHPSDSARTPPVVSNTLACDVKTSKALKLSQPQNPSVITSVDGENSTKAASSSVIEPQAPSSPAVIISAQGTSANLDAGT